MRLLGAFGLLALAAPVLASPESADARVEAKSREACRKASGLANVTVGPAVRFSDELAIDVRSVTGTWPQPHMRGSPPARMLCLYHRRTGYAEAQEQPARKG